MTGGKYRVLENEELSDKKTEITSRRRNSGVRGQTHEPETMSKSALTAADYFKMLNIETAKLISILLVISFGAYHGILNLTYGVTPCKGLFLDGVYKEGGDGLWQPWGCMMHKYTNTDTERCFRYNGFYREPNHFVFVGDSRMRQIYLTFQSFLKNGDFEPRPPKSEEDEEVFQAHHDLSWSSGVLNLKLDFVWAPVANESMTQAIQRWSKDENFPSVFVFGCATHSIKNSNNSAEALFHYTRNLTVLRPILENVSRRGKTKILWMLQPHINPENLHPARAAITNDAINKYNSAAKDVLSSTPGSKIILWNSLSRLSEAALDQMEDGLHLPQFVLKQAVLMLLNQHCNEKMNFNDGSCCKKSDQPTSLQLITFALFGGCALILFFKLSFKKIRAYTTYVPVKAKSSLVVANGNVANHLNMVDKAIQEIDNVEGLLLAFVKMGLILAYFYVCDRTNFFMKENKYFTHLNFWLPVMYILIVGLFFHEEAKQTTLLHRQQTDEWKGWMQLVILIYHMTGGSKSLPIYMLIRVLVSSYLFLNGFGHFSFGWKEIKDSAGKNTDLQKVIIRFFTVLFRMNFFAVLLCLAMNRPYQLYYFVPLISFWFAVQYVTHLLPPQVTAQSSESQPLQYLYIVLKLVALASVISILYMSEVFFEKVFVTRPWKALFVTTDDDIRAWWFRWKIDRYSSVFGIIFGFACGLGYRYRLYDDSHSGGLLWSKGTSLVVAAASILGLGGYSLFAALCSSKSDCTEIHPYVVFVPIVSFVLLRNISGWIRTRYSSFFAWFGRISLELFLAQYHIWLAADADGVLVLIPNYPVMNILLTSFIFVCAAHEIHKITEFVLPFLAPRNAKSVVRNVVIFVVILVPIGIHDGMF